MDSKILAGSDRRLQTFLRLGRTQIRRGVIAIDWVTCGLLVSASGLMYSQAHVTAELHLAEAWLA